MSQTSQNSRWGQSIFLFSCGLGLSFHFFLVIGDLIAPASTVKNEDQTAYRLIGMLVLLGCTWAGKKWAMVASIGLIFLMAVTLAVTAFAHSAAIAGAFSILNFAAAFGLLTPPVQDFLADQRAGRSRRRPASFEPTSKDEAAMRFLDGAANTAGDEPPPPT